MLSHWETGQKARKFPHGIAQHILTAPWRGAIICGSFSGLCPTGFPGSLCGVHAATTSKFVDRSSISSIAAEIFLDRLRHATVHWFGQQAVVMNAEPTKRVGDYEIVGVLGRGGMGNVFKVRNVLSDRVEAMKILLPDLAQGQELADRFRREIKLLASLDHPNIAAFRTALTWDNYLVMIMEYVEGMTLATRVAGGPLPLGEAVDCTQQVLSALAYAHARHIIHRDVKPANIMVTPKGVVKLMDFGIARSRSDATMTTTGTTLGSLYYMSPEQVKGEPVDERSDLYSLGITLYELVTGKRPFAEDSDFSIMAAQLNKQPKPPIMLREDLPPALSGVIMKAIIKEPGQRFQTAAEFSEALKELAISRHEETVARDATNAATATHGVFTAATRSLAGVTPASAAAVTGPVRSGSGKAASVTVRNQVQMPAPAIAVSDLTKPVRPRYRGLYMSMGACIVLLVVVAAGLYLPRREVTHSAAPTEASAAKTQVNDANKLEPATPLASTSPTNPSQASSTQNPPVAQTTSNQPKAELASAVTAAVGKDDSAKAASNEQSPSPFRGTVPLARFASKSRNRVAAGTQSRMGTATNIAPSSVSPANSSPGLPDNSAAASAPVNPSAIGNAVASTASAPPATPSASRTIDPATLNQLERERDLLSSRADSVNASLTSLRDAQQSQGMNLRGDIVSSQARMQRFLARAESALKAQNAPDTKRYLDLAETEINNLEKFLGR